MKHAKKLWALVLALVMVLALGVTASATEPVSEPTMKYRVDYTEYTEGGKGIKGGVFTMTNTADSTKVFEATSNENGVAVFENLPVGTYTLTQKIAPAGYKKAFCTNYKDSHAEAITVTVANGEVKDADNNTVYNGVYAVFEKDSAGSKCYQWENAPENLGYYVPALFQSEKVPMTTIKIPFTKVVKLGGNANADSQAFELEIFNIGNSNTSGYANVKYTAKVETNGEGTYKGEIVITGPESEVEAFTGEGFYVREKNTKADNWTYSDALWYVLPVDSVFTVYPGTKQTTDNGDSYDYDLDKPVKQMTFTNTYTRHVSHTRTETKIESPKTFDAGIGLYAVSALLSVTGSAWLVGKKHK